MYIIIFIACKIVLEPDKSFHFNSMKWAYTVLLRNIPVKRKLKKRKLAWMTPRRNQMASVASFIVLGKNVIKTSSVYELYIILYTEYMHN
jgi:hypothetical protein